MSDCGPTSPKRTRYMLRSIVGNEHRIAEHNEPTDRKRKRKGLQLMDLNDDCLLAILERLDAVELVDIAETCKRAQSLAQYTFRLKHHRLDLTTIPRINLKLAMRLLRNFGGNITSLNIPRKMLSPETTMGSNKILTLIGRHCHTNLEELSLKNIRMTPASIVHVEKVFGSLNTLVLENFSLRDCDFSSLNDHLEVLKLKHVDFFDSSASDLNIYKPLTTFLTTARALKHLSITECRRLPCNILKAIGQCTQLEELEIQLNMKAHDNVVKSKLLQLGTLKELKVLKMGCSGISPQLLLKEFVAKNVGIEHLELTRIEDNSLVQVITELKTIKVLKLYDVHYINDAHLLSLAKGLSSLNELHIACWAEVVVTPDGCVEMLREANKLSCLHIDVPDFDFDMYAYNEMLKIIKKRPDHIKLELTFHSDDMEPALDPDDALRTNEQWLKVTQIHTLPTLLPLFLIFFG